MKLRLALALSALTLPAHAQSLPTPNLGAGTKLNGANLQNAATKTTGTSVADPGTGALENLLPVQTFTGASHTFVAADLYKETRRSNSGSAMTDTFPGTSTAGLANGTTIQLNNVDTTASITLSAGGGTTLNGNSSVSIPPNRSTKWVYDAPNTVWRTTMNSLAGVNGPSSATSGNIASFNGSSGTLIQDSGKGLPSGTVVGTSDTQTLTNKSIDASEINSGTLASARGGAGAINGALKGNGSGVVSQAACADLSNGATGCSTATGTSGATIPLNNAANTFSALETFGAGIAATQSIGTTNTLDASGQTTVSVTNGGSATIAFSNMGMVLITDINTGHTALFLLLSGVANLIATDSNWVTGGSPAAGNSSIAWNGSAFAIFNNTGATHGYKAITFRTH
jgi:hypothetical protein